MQNHVPLCIDQLFLQQEEILNYPTQSQTHVQLLYEQFTQQIAELEAHYSRTEIINMIHPLRQELRRSAFFKRLQDWPRGYQGDFETIDAIMHYKIGAPKHTLAYIFECYFMHAPIAQQHRNKVQEQYKAIVQCIQQNPAAKILSIGCGTSEDIYKASTTIQTSTAEITLLDIDADALDYSICKLNTIKAHIHTQQGNIYKLLQQIDEVYDLILIGGVFDYVSDKFMMNILKKLYTHNLCNTGALLFTNIADNNPFKISLEYFFDWFLIERSKNDISRIITACGIDATALHIKKESMQLSYIVHLYKHHTYKKTPIREREGVLADILI
ncbi:MAG TPA: class I SAM-dependent methyltransferase [Chitinophagaceae bacterium]|nr:class I SAM-dependent methyltransferase [Chitinophagaceae bacterium]